MNDVFLPIATEQTTIILPAPIAWAAAQFASKDTTKGALVYIQIQRNGNETVTVRSTDGHKAFRVILPNNLAYSTVGEILIPAAEFSKHGKLLTAQWLHFRNDGTAAAINPAGSIVELRQWTRDNYPPTFPNVDQVWPDSWQYHCEPGTIMGVNGSYLATIGTVCHKLSLNSVLTIETANHNAPMNFTADYRDTDARLEFLLMPVQLRNDEHKRRQDAKKERDERRARDAKELAAYRAGRMPSLPELAAV